MTSITLLNGTKKLQLELWQQYERQQMRINRLDEFSQTNELKDKRAFQIYQSRQKEYAYLLMALLNEVRESEGSTISNSGKTLQSFRKRADLIVELINNQRKTAAHFLDIDSNRLNNIIQLTNYKKINHAY